MNKLLAGMALAVGILVAGSAQASSGGITGRTGESGNWCYLCHGAATAGYVVSASLPAGPYVTGNTYQVTFRVQAASGSPSVGINFKGSGPANGGTLTKSAGEAGDWNITSGQGRHTSPRTLTGGQSTWKVDWRVPPVGQSGANTVRFFAASNGGGQRGTMTTPAGSTCDTNNTTACGFPVTIPRLNCDDVDGDGYFPTGCYADTTNFGGDCNDNSQQAFPGGVERCDGVDNDCDGLTDEGFTLGGKSPGATCDGNDADLCLDGIVTCNGDGMTLSCVETVDNTELCDGVDNDCDGQTDEDYSSGGKPVGAACDGFDPDLCALGTVKCTNTFLAACVETAPNRNEICNSADDDCDGMTDEGYTGLGTACDGPDPDVCANGTRVCKVDGSGTMCMETVSATEICDGLDNDCDGATDELFPSKGMQCDGVDMDVCRMGTFTCTADGMGVQCVNESMSFVELCNGMDDDCDMLVDEGCMTPSDAGMPQDAAAPADAAMVDAAMGVPDAAGCVPAPETCNGRDDNCNGQTDEGFVGLGTSCDGPDDDLCAAGTRYCTLDGTGTYCAEVVSYLELCNAQDDDCDGMTDEGFVYRGLPVGQPCDGPDSDRCSNGAVVCRADGFGVLCSETVNFLETCNGLDDNCDGNTDEGYFGIGVPCDGPDTDSCELGMIACLPDGSGTDCFDNDPRVEMCMNAVDDDCDGLTDEMCAFLDAGRPDSAVRDAAVAMPDAAVANPDAAVAMPDAAMDPPDAAMVGMDASMTVMDAGRSDAARLDAAGMDAAGMDAAGMDSGRTDSGRMDAGRTDAGRMDAAGLDAAGRDAAAVAGDAAVPDAGPPRSRLIDRSDAAMPPMIAGAAEQEGCSSAGGGTWTVGLLLLLALRRRRV